MDELTPSILNEKARTDSANEVVREHPGIQNNLEEFIRAVGKKFITKQINNFPYLCEVTRCQNLLEFENNRKHGKKGKYTDSYGWSEDGTFKFDYKIPQEMYLFMQNLVYQDFWSDDNERVWRRFMKRVCDGDDPYDCLMQAKSLYGTGYTKKESLDFGSNN